MASLCRAVSSQRLVPGDVIVVLRGKATCDMVLLRGSCLCEESMLSGEVSAVPLLCQCMTPCMNATGFWTACVVTARLFDVGDAHM